MSLKPKLSLVLIAAAAAAPLGGCKKSGKTKAGPTPSAAPAAASAATPKPAAQGIPVDKFAAEIAPTTCDWIEQCKNDKVKAIPVMMAMMVAGFGSMGKPALKKQMDAVSKSMDKDKRWLPNKQECLTIGGIALKLQGLSADTLKAKIGKTVKYDPVKASACLASFKSPFAPCKKEVKLAKDPNLGQTDKFEKQFKGKLDAYTKACNGALTGMVALGGTCEYGFECKGEHTGCRPDPKDHKKKTCQAKKQKKK